VSRLDGKWMSTDELRLFYPAARGEGDAPVLQRRWVNLDTGLDEDWRPIPVVYEEELIAMEKKHAGTETR